MRFEIQLLGRFAVHRDGEPIAPSAFGGQLAQRLVRLLVIRRGEVQTREALIDSLWGEHAPADPEANLNVLVNRARRGLGDAGVIETVANGYAMNTAADIDVDVERFEADLRMARAAFDRGHLLHALTGVRTALGTWRGEPLPEDAYTEWAQPHRDQLERAHQEALELGAAAALGAGHLPQASALAAEAVSRQPLREAAHLLYIRALAANGDTAAALAAHDALRRRLADELGIDPSREAADLHQRLLNGDVVAYPITDAPSTPAAGASASVVPRFVGREQELARLSDMDSAGIAAGTGGRRVAVVSGRSGSGKSRLLDELIARTDRRVLLARAVLPEREAPWSLARTLLRAAIDAGADPRVLPVRSRTALADLVPELIDEGSTAAVDAQSRRALAFEGAVRLVTALGRALVVVDDLQWADASSLDLLAVVASRADAVTMVLAYRPEEVPVDQEVAAFLSDLRAATGPLEAELGPLDAAAADRLVGHAELASVLAEATDGTPFAVLEVLRTLEQQGAVRRHGDVWRPVSPDVLDRARAEARTGQRRSVTLRADRQTRPRRELLGLLAILGRPAPAQLLARATGTTAAEVDTHMDGLARAELARHDERGWATAHDLVSETLHDRLDPIDRARLHQLLARALERDPSASGERARHLAGAGDQPAAAAAYAAAARQRLDRFADREAQRLAHAGLDLEPSDQTRVELLEVRAETRFRAGALTDARDDLRHALTLADAGADRSRLLARLAALASGAEDLLRAANLIDLALAEARDDPRARARALAVGAIVDMNLERAQRAEARYAEALSLFKQVGDARGVADVLDARAMATFLNGDISGGVAAFDRVARLFSDAGDLLRVVTPRSTRGHGLVFAAAPQDGLSDIEEALELARSLGSPEGQAYTQWHRSEALTACGHADQGARAAAEALAIAECLGHRGWTATALRALGIARDADGDIDGAEDAFQRSLASSDHLPLFACWANARLALVLVSANRLDEAADHVQQALATGPPLGHYEARLAHCELAVARAEPDAASLIADATDRAALGGHRTSLMRLSTLRAIVAGRH